MDIIEMGYNIAYEGARVKLGKKYHQGNEVLEALVKLDQWEGLVFSSDLPQADIDLGMEWIASARAGR